MSGGRRTRFVNSTSLRRMLCERLIVSGAGAALAGHQFIDVWHASEPQRLRLHALGLGLQVYAARAVVAQVAHDVMERRADELARNRKPQPAVRVVAHLPDDQITRVQVLARVERACVEAVVVEEMRRHFMLREKDQHARVQVQLAEDPQRVYVFHRNHAPLVHGDRLRLLALKRGLFLRRHSLRRLRFEQQVAHAVSRRPLAPSTSAPANSAPACACLTAPGASRCGRRLETERVVFAPQPP